MRAAAATASSATPACCCGEDRARRQAAGGKLVVGGWWRRGRCDIVEMVTRARCAAEHRTSEHQNIQHRREEERGEKQRKRSPFTSYFLRRSSFLARHSTVPLFLAFDVGCSDVGCSMFGPAAGSRSALSSNLQPPSSILQPPTPYSLFLPASRLILPLVAAVTTSSPILSLCTGPPMFSGEGCFRVPMSVVNTCLAFAASYA